MYAEATLSARGRYNHPTLSEPWKQTRWTYIVAGGKPGDQRYEEAWCYLVDTYRGVIQSYFIRHAPDPATATEWTDEFMAGWVEGKLGGADRNKGMFRQFLFGALRNFRYKQYRKARTRGSSAPIHENIPDRSAPDSDDAFQRDFTNQVLQGALGKLESYQRGRREKGSSSAHYDLLTDYHIKPATRAEQPTQQELAERYGLTAKAVERQLDQARQKLRDWILASLKELVSGQDELQEEIQLLLDHCRDALEGCF